ncbi:uncharacterized protein K441DRAFT_668937 [Cenococcum geophilum 1.58]|uniref:uncharacterized protein n=1 Tax=Cenococcum geophilum 1.58 TaxID=794803 RepID=UPI00358F6B3D|nr:hypothetical protein K441DRAFT_668937 [Cenococcum geophilum 1.58]
METIHTTIPTSSTARAPVPAVGSTGDMAPTTSAARIISQMFSCVVPAWVYQASNFVRWPTTTPPPDHLNLICTLHPRQAYPTDNDLRNTHLGNAYLFRKLGSTKSGLTGILKYLESDLGHARTMTARATMIVASCCCCACCYLGSRRDRPRGSKFRELLP